LRNAEEEGALFGGTPPARVKGVGSVLKRFGDSVFGNSGFVQRRKPGGARTSRGGGRSKGNRKKGGKNLLFHIRYNFPKKREGDERRKKGSGCNCAKDRKGLAGRRTVDIFESRRGVGRRGEVSKQKQKKKPPRGGGF